jgi:CubicO group peptidase (beta-lactamase class C family)
VSDRDRDLTDLLSMHAARSSVPGAAIGILRHGEARVACYGVANAITGAPITAETRFAIGSLGKSMLATVVAGLVEAGQLELDDPVSSRVPELRDTRWAQTATVRDLLANRSGLPLRSEFEFSTWPDDDDDVLSRLAGRLSAVQPEPVPPFWSYSNAGWCLLGRAVEAVTGRAWAQAMQTSLVVPFGLAQTSFADTADVSLASGHEVTAAGVRPVTRWMPRNLAPAGSTALSTAADLLRFAGRHLDDDALAPLRKTHAKIALPDWLDAWCLGWARFDWPGGPVWGWDGLVNGQRASLRMMPDQHAAVVLLANSDTGRRLYRSLFAELMPAWFGIEMPAVRLTPSPGAAGDLSRFSGTYAWPDRRYEVTATADGLLLTETHSGGAAGTQEAVRTEALPIDERTFLVDAADPDTPTITFGSFDSDGRPGVLYQMLWGLPRLWTVS